MFKFNTKFYWFLGVLLFTLFCLAPAVQAAPDAVLSKGTYTQKKYHKIKNRINEWHYCDFSINTTLKGDFSSLNPQATLDLSITQTGFQELFVLAGELNQLGGFEDVKNGGKLILSPGEHNLSGSIQWNNKQLVIKLKANTSKESMDYLGGNYLLPIDEDIFTFTNGVQKLRRPFTGAATEKIGLRLPEESVPTFYSFSMVYKGVNSNPNNLPSQTLTGALLKE